MKAKILNEKLITDTARESEVDLDIAKRVINSYYKCMREQLSNGSTIITPLGNMYISVRNLNANLSNKKSTHKLIYKINKNYQKILDGEQE